MDDIVVRLVIQGKVQGVGYRGSMVREARRLGLRGWVRNRLDGSVEATISGTPGTVDRMVEWAWTGPAWAAVQSVDVSAGEGTYDSFDPWPTE